MLKIPSPQDPQPTLVVPQTAVSPEYIKKRKRRRGGSSHNTEDQWSGRERSTGGRSESRQMFWMLAGGGTLFALVVAGVLAIILGESQPPVVVNASTAGDSPPAAEVIPASVNLSDADFLSAAEPLARAFLTAGTADELLPLVRNPDSARPRIQSRYPEGEIDVPGMAAFNTRLEVTRQGASLSVLVRTADMLEKRLAFFPTAEGLEIDWESWAGWSDMPWQEFLATKPEQDTMFRVVLSPVEYYNFGFIDDRKWQSYRLVSPDGEHAIYGYVERGSPLDLSLRLSPDQKQANLTLLLRFPPNASSQNQVLIAQLLAEGWVLDNDE